MNCGRRPFPLLFPLSPNPREGPETNVAPRYGGLALSVVMTLDQASKFPSQWDLEAGFPNRRQYDAGDPYCLFPAHRAFSSARLH
jgi:hypothetical protein